VTSNQSKGLIANSKAADPVTLMPADLEIGDTAGLETCATLLGPQPWQHLPLLKLPLTNFTVSNNPHASDKYKMPGPLITAD
jgi:hypothetical protein